MIAGFIEVSCPSNSTKFTLRTSCIECVYLGSDATLVETTFIEIIGREEAYRVKESVREVLQKIARAEALQ